MPNTLPDAPLEGGCLCGDVRFRLAAPPMITHCCHCRRCQRTAGSAFAVNAMIETAMLTVTKGATASFHASGQRKVVHCPRCRTALWWHIDKLGDAIAMVAVGALDAGERLPPEAHYFIRSKHPWVTIPADLPAFDELGDPGKAGVRERIVAALAAQAGDPH